MPSAGFEPSFPASKPLQTYALDRTTTISGGRRSFSVFPSLFSRPVTYEPLWLVVMLGLPTFILLFSAIGCKTKRGGFSNYEVVVTAVSRDAGP